MLSALVGRGQPQNVVRVDWAAGGSWGESGASAGLPRVTQSSAMQLLAVYGSVRLIADSISTMPVDVFRQDAAGLAIEQTGPAWLSEPTPDLTFEAWLGQVLSSLLLHGNAYVQVFRAGARIVALVPLDPAVVSVRREGGRKVFAINGRDAVGVEILHVQALMLPGTDVGLSPIEYARQSVGLGLAAQQYGAEFFAGEGNMPGVIEMPGDALPGQEAELAKQWRRKRTTGGRGLPGVLKNGAQWKPTGVTNEQAQFLATRQYTAAEIAGQMFLVDPSDLGIPVQGTSLTYSNLEQRNARRVQVTLLPWIVRLERALSSLLPAPRYVKFNVSGLLRGDQKARYESYAIGILNGFLDPSEPRGWEDLGPMPNKGGAGDEPQEQPA